MDFKNVSNYSLMDRHVFFPQTFSFINDGSVTVFTYMSLNTCVTIIIGEIAKSKITESKGMYIKILLNIAKLPVKICTLLHPP